MNEMYTAADFALDGVRCPPRVCRLVATRLLPILRAELRDFGTVDHELAVWLRAAEEVGRRWATDAGVSENSGTPRTSSQSNHEQFTTAQIAEELDCTAHNVRDAVRRGRLTPARRKPHMLFDRVEVDRFKESRHQPA